MPIYRNAHELAKGYDNMFPLDAPHHVVIMTKEEYKKFRHLVRKEQVYKIPKENYKVSL